ATRLRAAPWASPDIARVAAAAVCNRNDKPLDRLIRARKQGRWGGETGRPRGFEVNHHSVSVVRSSTRANSGVHPMSRRKRSSEIEATSPILKFCWRELMSAPQLIGVVVLSLLVGKTALGQPTEPTPPGKSAEEVQAIKERAADWLRTCLG